MFFVVVVVVVVVNVLIYSFQLFDCEAGSLSSFVKYFSKKRYKQQFKGRCSGTMDQWR